MKVAPYRRPKMYTSLCFIVISVLILQGTNSSEEIRWITRHRTLSACKGHTLDLNWEFDVNGNKIRALEWYFNDILICAVSDKDQFEVEPAYRDKIQRFGESGILLKNISLDDEGTFTLLPVLYWSASESMQSIILQVSEPPTDTCMVKIRFAGDNWKLTCDISPSDCGRPLMSAVWKRSKTFELLAEGNFIEINSSFNDTEILCCPQGKAMNCTAEDCHRFCSSMSLSFNKSLTETNNNTLQNDSDTTKVTHSVDTDGGSLHDPHGFILLVTCVIASSVAAIVSIVSCRAVKVLVAEMNLDKNARHTEQTFPHLAINEEANYISIELSEEAVPLMDMEATAVSTPPHLSDRETKEAATDHQPSTSLKTTREKQKIQKGALCKICLTNERSMLYIPCNHKRKDTTFIPTCVSCSNDFIQCQDCISPMNMNNNNTVWRRKKKTNEKVESAIAFSERHY